MNAPGVSQSTQNAEKNMQTKQNYVSQSGLVGFRENFSKFFASLK